MLRYQNIYRNAAGQVIAFRFWRLVWEPESEFGPRGLYWIPGPDWRHGASMLRKVF